jgi:hypothetical protein
MLFQNRLNYLRFKAFNCMMCLTRSACSVHYLPVEYVLIRYDFFQTFFKGSDGIRKQTNFLINAYD